MEFEITRLSDAMPCTVNPLEHPYGVMAIRSEHHKILIILCSQCLAKMVERDKQPEYEHYNFEDVINRIF